MSRRKVIIIVWLALWVNFIARDLFVRGYVKDYVNLAAKDAEGQRAYTYGKQFYEFLKLAKNDIPQNKSFKFTGIDAFSLAHRRAVYYLYPLLEKDNPDYILDAGRFTITKAR